MAEAGSPVGDPGADLNCQICHAAPGLKMQLRNGEIMDATVDLSTYRQSVHGGVLQCTACHADIAGYPHGGRDVARAGVRDIPYLVRSYANCGSCHLAEYNEYVGSVHAQALNQGKSDSAVCSDCHGAHDVGPAAPTDVGLALGPAVYSCGACHKEEFDQYQNGVHGKAVLEEGAVDVPTCVDCHGAHNMHKAKDSPSFRSQTVALCSSCHADPKLMQQHGLSTDILATYAADFHGKSNQLFRPVADQAPAQAMCYDCHGNHDIQSTVSTNGLILKENLLKACQKCHEDATLNFPAAWLGHYESTTDRSAPVFWTGMFFTALTVTTMIGLIVLIILDVARSARDQVQGVK